MPNEAYYQLKNTKFYLLEPDGPDKFIAYSPANLSEFQENGNPAWEVVYVMGYPAFQPNFKKGKAVFRIEKL